MVVGICDDDRNWCIKASEMIEKYAEETMWNIEVNFFRNEKELLAYVGRPLEILFLDIELEEENGIDIAFRINKRWERCQIVYLTNYLFYATEVYLTIHTFFVLKEQFEVKIGKIFQKAFHELKQQEKKLIFNVIGGSEIVLAPDEIFYFERIKRLTCIVTVWGQYEIWDKLNDIEKKLPEPEFVRCHNSYIVYLPAIRELLKNAFIMNNGVKIMISRSHLKLAKGAFMRWALTQIF